MNNREYFLEHLDFQFKADYKSTKIFDQHATRLETTAPSGHPHIMNPYHYQDVFVHDYPRHFAGRRYLTNMPRDLMPLVEQALERSGRGDIHIDPDPIPSPHQALNTGMFSIWVETDCDCSNFWRAYEAVKQDPVWSTWLTLTRTP